MLISLKYNTFYMLTQHAHNVNIAHSSLMQLHFLDLINPSPSKCFKILGFLAFKGEIILGFLRFDKVFSPF